MMNIKLKLSQIFLIALLVFGDSTRGDEYCKDKMKGMMTEYESCIDPMATFEEFCKEANEVTVENPDDEKIIKMIPKYCTGIEQEMRCTKILTNSSNECRFLSQDAVDRSEKLGSVIHNFFCANDGKNFLEFALNGELKKFDAHGVENECKAADMNGSGGLFTETGEFNMKFCGQMDEVYKCFEDYFAATDNPNLKNVWTELHLKSVEAAQC